MRAWLSSLIALASAAAFAQSAPPAEPVSKKATITVAGKPLAYTATAGVMPLRSEEGDVEGNLFYVAYTKDGEDPARRPLTFAYNGGPGSSTMWLHLGGLAPKRVLLTDAGDMPPPPFRLVDNADTWLAATDLVFVDAMGTGYSRPAKADNRKFYGMRSDIEAFGEFVRAYLAKYKRFGSPLFLCGESYGGIRTAGLARHLLDRGIALNGALIVSGVTNYATLRFGRGHYIPYIGYLPSFAATAWYHKKLAAAQQKKGLDAFLREVEEFAGGEYALALQSGTSMSKEQIGRVAERMSAFTGLGKQYILDSHLKISPSRFFKELLRSDGKTVGRLDSRFTGRDGLEVGDSPEYDPSSSAITPVFAACINDYIGRDLGYVSDQRYRINNYSGMGTWDYGPGTGFPDTSDDLRRAMNENPHMKVLFLCGYYDLATPYYAMHYTVNQMDLGPKQLSNISWSYYPAGHMMYIEKASRERLRGEVEAFYRAALGERQG